MFMLKHNLLAYLPFWEEPMSVFEITPQELARWQGGTTELIDVRTPVEFRAVHVRMPRQRAPGPPRPRGVARRPAAGRTAVRGLPVGHAGKTGLRKVARRRSDRRLERGGRDRACRKAGLPVVCGRKAISLERQVRIAAGSLVLLGVAHRILAFAFPAFGVRRGGPGFRRDHGHLRDGLLLLARMPVEPLSGNRDAAAGGRRRR